MKAEGCGRGQVSAWGWARHAGAFSLWSCFHQFQHFRERLPSTFFHQFRNPNKGITSQSNYNLTKYFSLTQGTYVVVVSAHKAVEFLLRIFLKMPESDRNLGSNFNLRALKGLNIDASQLQSLLNQELLTGKVRPMGPPALTSSPLPSQSSVSAP